MRDHVPPDARADDAPGVNEHSSAHPGAQTSRVRRLPDRGPTSVIECDARIAQARTNVATRSGSASRTATGTADRSGTRLP